MPTAEVPLLAGLQEPLLYDSFDDPKAAKKEEQPAVPAQSDSKRLKSEHPAGEGLLPVESEPPSVPAPEAVCKSPICEGSGILSRQFGQFGCLNVPNAPTCYLHEDSP